MKDTIITKEDVRNLLRNYSIEVTPKTVKKIADIESMLSKDVTVYVTFLPNSSFEDTLDCCAFLRKRGYEVVPHIAARSIPSKKMLHESLQEINRLKIKEVLLIGGAVKKIIGNYSSVLELLNDNDLSAYGIEHVGFAGHPEGSPDIADEVIKYSEKLKQDYAHKHPCHYYFLTQFCFQAHPLLQWMAALRERGILIRVHVGIPGVASVKSLLSHAHSCGVGASMSYLTNNITNIGNILRLSKPNQLIYDLSVFHTLHSQESLIERLHFYPLGGFKQTINWINSIQKYDFSFNAESGIIVND